MADINPHLVSSRENKPLRDENGRLLPGHTANPNGRPPGTVSITTEIKRKLAECPEGQKATYLELLISRILKKAIQDGDQSMITRVWNYVDGMPKQSLKIDDDSTLTVIRKIINADNSGE